jgi:gamma-glutamylcyclotransferase (GGCT)/AIG2-like uncharacterized protein YtfP
MRAIAGRVFEHTDARLPDYSAYRVAGEDFPALIPDRGGVTDGCLWWGLTEATLRRLDRFEGGLYLRKPLRVQTRNGPRLAWTYLLRPLYRDHLSAQLWDYERFRAGALGRYVRAGAVRP